ncbi:MAG TPA: transcription-repair coupling factor, partial [Candidatus Acidoferrales bacterium]|nr:transcription-repair coupling factor [Candidatus Acidoferrales bacterium]
VSLWRVATSQAPILILPVTSGMLRLRERNFYEDLARTLVRDATAPLEEFVAHLISTGYERHDTVEMPGHFALRGGIVDLFSAEAARPVRIELFGDTVESIREFDPNTQRSVRPLERTTVLPLTDVPRRPDVLEKLHSRAAGETREGGEYAGTYPGWEFDASLLEPAQSSIFNLCAGAFFVLDEPDTLNETSRKFAAHLQDSYEHLAAAGNSQGSDMPAPTPLNFYLSEDEWSAALSRCSRLLLEHLPMHEPGRESLVLETQPTTPYHGNVTAFMTEVRAHLQSGKQGIACAANIGELERLAGLCHEFELAYRLGEVGDEATLARLAEDSSAGSVPALTLVKAPLNEGVRFPDLGLTLYGNSDLFETLPVPERPRRRPKTATFFSDFSDLQPGDYVVHVDHGIGQFEGLRQIESEGRGEFMLLRYAEESRLYVPLARMDLVQKYSALEGNRPPLDRLGGTAWAARKQRVRKSVTEMADKLLRLYAQRKSGEGHAFAKDNEFQREFEDAFEFEETTDQARAIEDTKHDMERGAPMDRLLCGDVGYGKTEVAMRAAFKAVNDGKQVAILAPTTVLVFQHYETLRRRFAPFPVNIEMLSRFRSAKEQKKILESLEAGQVDIVVGTHRLLSRDVRFHDLGLLVVDEEQRFGVAHKERLKEMRHNVDVLTMSATPIPRTLHMSIVGLRDMSVIETPPKDRLAIQTVVAPFSETLVQGAIEQELAREGQIYFLHNRVESIYSVASLLQRLVPRARIVVGHGQMGEKELERAMLRFIQRDADILVSTTIIENGLDIPRANTMLINRADRFGLSELYQLRGRVGRSNQRAYAYLLVPQEKTLSELARKRLAALREFSELGAGFRIAALDLELRGAGNLLGAEQHGHVNAVGFDLYCRMLERAVAELKGEAPAAELRSTLNLGVDIRIPAEYIPGENLRLRTYKRIAGVTNEIEREEVARELADRFGPLPPAVEHLLDYAVLKALCERLLVASLERKGESVAVKFHSQTPVQPAQLVKVVRNGRGMRLDPSGVLWLPANRPAVAGGGGGPAGVSGAGVTESVRNVLLQLQS